MPSHLSLYTMRTIHGLSELGEKQLHLGHMDTTVSWWFEHESIQWETFDRCLFVWVRYLETQGYIPKARKVEDWQQSMIALKKRFHRAYWLAAINISSACIQGSCQDLSRHHDGQQGQRKGEIERGKEDTCSEVEVSYISMWGHDLQNIITTGKSLGGHFTVLEDLEDPIVISSAEESSSDDEVIEEISVTRTAE